MSATNLQTTVQSSANTAQQKCLVCDKKIVDGRWFCKIPREDKPTAVLCCPGCSLRYFDSLHSTTNADEIERAACERSVHFLVGDEKP